MPLDGTNKDLGRFVMSTPAPMVFEGIFEAKKIKISGKEQGDPKFSLGLAFGEDHPDFADMKKTAVAVARAQWPGVDLATLKFPFRRGNDFITDQEKKGKAVKDPETFAGKIMITARTKNPPNLSGFEGGRIVDYTDAAVIASKKSALFYRGVNVLCELYFAASEPNGARVVSIFLNKVMSTGKGTKLAGGASSGASTFGGYVGHHTDSDPSKGLDDDEIPF